MSNPETNSQISVVRLDCCTATQHPPSRLSSWPAEKRKPLRASARPIIRFNRCLAADGEYKLFVHATALVLSLQQRTHERAELGVPGRAENHTGESDAELLTDVNGRRVISTGDQLTLIGVKFSLYEPAISRIENHETMITGIHVQVYVDTW